MASKAQKRKAVDELDDEREEKGDGKKDVRNSEAWEPLEKTLDEDLEDAGNEIQKQLKEQQKKLLDSLDLKQYFSQIFLKFFSNFSQIFCLFLGSWILEFVSLFSCVDF
jgi:hypothetical protein